MSCDVRIYIDKWQYNSLPMQTERHGRSGLCGKAVYAGACGAEVQKAAVCALKAWLQAKTGESAGRQKRGGKHGEIKTGGSDDGRFGAQEERTVAEKPN